MGSKFQFVVVEHASSSNTLQIDTRRSNTTADPECSNLNIANGTELPSSRSCQAGKRKLYADLNGFYYVGVFTRLLS